MALGVKKTPEQHTKTQTQTQIYACVYKQINKSLHIQYTSAFSQKVLIDAMLDVSPDGTGYSQKANNANSSQAQPASSLDFQQAESHRISSARLLG